MIMNKRTYILLLFFLIGTNFVQAQEVQPTWESINERGYPEFIHWGLYSVPAYSAPDGYSEWFYRGLMTGDSIRVGEMKDFNRRWGYMLGDQWSGRLSNGDGMKQNPKPTDLYTLYAMTWAAEHWNPEQWADLFVQSGAKYVVLVTKHHDGYCLWRSRYQPNWNSVTTGPRRDIVGELAAACRKHGLRLGLYYSQDLDWHERGGGGYKNGKTCKEMSLPYNEVWTDRVFSEGWQMNPELKGFKIQIFNKISGATINTQCWGTTVRMAPIRPFERADKHIVLFLR